MQSVRLRPLERRELGLLWSIDRSEVIDAAYRLVDGRLVREATSIDVRGWPPDEAARDAILHGECFERGGSFLGAFDDDGLVAAAVLDSRLLGKRRDQLQLTFLHVSRSHRGHGIGAWLFDEMRTLARGHGARWLYVSATPSANTVEFYLRRGCVVAQEPDPWLLALEPEDIHLVCPLRVP